jgi:hypothetical protein
MDARTQTIAAVSTSPAGAVEDLSLDVPREWQRRTLLSYSPPENAGLDGVTITVVHEPLAGATTLQAVASRHLAEVRDAPEFCASDIRRRVLDGREALELSYEWRTDDGPVVQTATFAVTEGDWGPMVTIVTTTCARCDATAMSPIFARMIASMRFGKPPTSGIPSMRVDQPPRSDIAPKMDQSNSSRLPELPPMPLVPFPIPGRHRRG